jgi:hypothetical protein
MVGGFSIETVGTSRVMKNFNASMTGGIVYSICVLPISAASLQRPRHVKQKGTDLINYQRSGKKN